MALRKSLCWAGPLLMASGFNLIAEAQRGRQRWEYLGQSNVDGRRDHDTIRVRSGRTFRAIRLQVQSGAIEFNRVLVRFESGEDTDVSIRGRIPAGGKTRVINLPGSRRRIQSVEVWYEDGRQGRRKPRLLLYGLR